jgi:hypothetical protein
MQIAVLPYEWRTKGRLADVPLGQLNWPLGGPERSGCVGDLTDEDHLIVYPRSGNFWNSRLGVRCNISLIVPEPYVIHRRNYWLAILFQRRFFRIITHRPAMARWVDNLLLMPFGGTWVDPDKAGNGDKSKHMSLIASSKRRQKGQILRHEIADWCVANDLDVDLLGLAYNPIEKKEEGLQDYRYSIVIENGRETGYFSEKLIDCLLCKTVPIYWGAPDIGQYFDLDGMIVCETAFQLQEAIANASEDDYKRRQIWIKQNYHKALRYVDYEKNAVENLLPECSGATDAANNGNPP